MHTLLRHARWFIAGLLMAASPTLAAGLPAASRQDTWPMQCLEKPVLVSVYLPPGGAGHAKRGRGAVVYLKNLAAPRAGTEPDESILTGLLDEGLIVLVLDLQNQPKAVAPHLNDDLRMLRRGLGRLFSAEAVNANQVYVLAEGDRLKRNIVYYDKNGEKYRLDLRYPSRPKQPSPVLMQIPVSNDNRLDNKSGHYRYNDLIAECGLTLGYAVALVDPPLKSYNGIDKMPEVAWRLKAAVRTIRSEAAACNLSDKIGVMGFSRSSGQAAILAFSGGLAQLEGDGPHQQFSSNVQAALIHAGRMDHELLVGSGHPIAKTYLHAWGPPVSEAELKSAEGELAAIEKRPAKESDKAAIETLRAKASDLRQRRARWRDASAVTYVTPDDP
ncbi:MAG: hypothetical protein K8T91_22540, partial [Planctomycetes bacterium]|nr:hypothetical protein [Planctomycetota bacterium]